MIWINILCLLNNFYKIFSKMLTAFHNCQVQLRDKFNWGSLWNTPCLQLDITCDHQRRMSPNVPVHTMSYFVHLLKRLPIWNKAVHLRISVSGMNNSQEFDMYDPKPCSKLAWHGNSECCMQGGFHNIKGVCWSVVLHNTIKLDQIDFLMLLCLASSWVFKSQFSLQK